MDDQWLTDLRIVQQHARGGRCTKCGARGGCLALLGAVRRRTARRASTPTAILINMSRLR